MTEPTPTTEDGEVIGIPPAPPPVAELPEPEAPPTSFLPPVMAPGDEVDPADL